MRDRGDAVDAVLRRLEAFGREHDAAESDRARKLLNLERDTAALVAMLVRSSGRTRILEIGTSNGYSTLWLAAATSQAPGAAPVTTVERDAAKHEAAAINARLAGLEERVRFLLGDATDVVRRLSGPFDCAFFDADRVSAPDQLALLEPKLTSDCLLLADNALSHPAEIAGYRAAVEALPGFDCIVVPVGKGLHVAHRRARPQ